MASTDDYDNRHDNNRYDSLRHMQRDVHDAHTASQLAKLLASLALIASIISMGLAGWALNKAGEAMSNANRAIEISQGR